MSALVPPRSWVTSANGHLDFALQNLPFGIFRRAASNEAPRVGVAIGDAILDVAACLAAGLFDEQSELTRQAARTCASPALNALMALGADARRALRDAVMALLHEDCAVHRQQIAQHALVPQQDAELFLPAQVGDYTDFYASVHHATNVGAMFRPDNPLLPNYKWVPIGYHGRASSLVVSGTPVRRPNGQRKGPTDDVPTVGPSRSLDYELELGAFVGTGNALGEPIPMASAESHLWGLCLLNDWSARDLQAWEYQPLGPFLAKNFASTISPWVVTLEALAPFRAPLAPRASGDPEPLPYLTDARDATQGGFALTVEVWLRTPRMRDEQAPPVRISQGSALDLYWSFAQMLAHHASSGCNLRPGDLLGSGTISGATPDSRGCLLELTRRGAEPLSLPNGETRGFLLDGDEITMTAYAERDGVGRIGFGRCVGEVRAAPALAGT
ncbi:fumarylacetoacetase [Gemmatimonas phototrophica]|uniref:fumarylacetoacetase n=1 Tax=Gemmatimonas phototrophica TaxID=1379270 RepID=A0A143BHI7_9BACT|nr:fumarylacetoacetase [Gemmatimonas phototrophica]AMW04071.1 fumarylacetoacetase [Gemmatimonas phototrophica]